MEIGERVVSLKEEGSSNTSNILDIPPVSPRIDIGTCHKKTPKESNPDQFQSSPSLRSIYKSLLIAGHDDLRLLKLH